jgi:hypothetical protein
MALDDVSTTIHIRLPVHLFKAIEKAHEKESQSTSLEISRGAFLRHVIARGLGIAALKKKKRPIADELIPRGFR